jgi:hypothetical protein
VVKHLTTIVVLALVLVGCGAPAVPTPEAIPESTIRAAASAARPSMLGLDNLAHGKPATASASLPDQPASASFDGDPQTVWNAGAHPPQWIEIDLGAAFDLDRVILTVAQDPRGRTVHQISGRGETGDYRLLLVFRDDTEDGQELDVSPVAAWAAVRYLKIETAESPSWVAWREIAVFGRPAEPQAALPGLADIAFHNGNLLTMAVTDTSPTAPASILGSPAHRPDRRTQ